MPYCIAPSQERQKRLCTRGIRGRRRTERGRRGKATDYFGQQKKKKRQTNRSRFPDCNIHRLTKQRAVEKSNREFLSVGGKGGGKRKDPARKSFSSRAGTRTP